MMGRSEGIAIINDMDFMQLTKSRHDLCLGVVDANSRLHNISCNQKKNHCINGKKNHCINGGFN